MGSLRLRAGALFATHCVLQSADRVLQFAGGLVGLAFSFELFVAQDLPGGLFYRSLGLLRALKRLALHGYAEIHSFERSRFADARHVDRSADLLR
jgi:hypothetical protein